MTWDKQMIDGVKVFISRDGVYEIVENHLKMYDLSRYGSYIDSFQSIKEAKDYAKEYKAFR